MARPRAAGQPEQIEIGQAICRERGIAGLTQAQLAEAAGIEQTVLSRLERGVAILTAHRARLIARALDITVDRLVGGGPADEERPTGPGDPAPPDKMQASG